MTKCGAFVWGSLFILLAQGAWAGSGKLTDSLDARLKAEGRADVIFFLKEKARLSRTSQISHRTQRVQYVYDQLRTTAVRSQREIISAIEAEGLEYRSFYIVNAVAVEGATAAQIRKLSTLSMVAQVSLDAKIQMHLPDVKVEDLTGSASPGEVADNLKQIGAEEAWGEGWRGFGIVVAGADSGYKWDHPAIRAQYRGTGSLATKHNYHWHDAIKKKLKENQKASDCGYNVSSPCDDQGHGTHTMGTMVGYEWATGANAIGVAPHAKWIGCRNMDQGIGKASTYIECFEFFLAPYPYGGDPKVDGRPAYAPHIVNNSWACPKSEGCTGGEFVDAIDALQAAVILVVASAGNEGSGCASTINAPGFYSGKLFSVAAYDHRDGEIADFSSRGPSPWNGGLGPNITAPGVGIRSSVPGGYDTKSGTSMSGPHVAGAVALLWSARPELIGNIAATHELIQRTATPRTSSQSCGKYPGSQVPNAVFGYGVIQIARAIRGF